MNNTSIAKLERSDLMLQSMKNNLCHYIACQAKGKSLDWFFNLGTSKHLSVKGGSLVEDVKDNQKDGDTKLSERALCISMRKYE